MKVKAIYNAKKHRIIGAGSLKDNSLVAVVIIIVGILGTIYLFNAKADTSNNSVETDKGTLTSNALRITDDTASNGRAVEFRYLRPSGQGITPYESLMTASDFNTTANGVSPAAQLSFPSNTYQFSDFNDGSNHYGILFNHSVLGIRGSVINKTIFEMTPMSSTKASSVPPQSTFPTGTNPLYLLRIDQSPVVSGFSLIGTDQGHLYNGMSIYQTTNAKISDLLIKGIPGDNTANPGETFSLNLYKNTSTTINNIEIDGSNSTGQKVGASAVGINYGSNTIINDLYVHNLQYGAAVAAYTTSNLTLNNPRVVDNHKALNFERVTGTVNINQPYIHNNIDQYGHTNTDISIANDTGTGIFYINDPIYDGPKLTVRVTGYMGNPRTQDPSTVKLYVHGVLRQDLMNLTITN